MDYVVVSGDSDAMRLFQRLVVATEDIAAKLAVSTPPAAPNIACSTNIAIDTIALANKFHSTLPLGEVQEFPRVVMQQFVAWVKEQQHQ